MPLLALALAADIILGTTSY